MCNQIGTNILKCATLSLSILIWCIHSPPQRVQEKNLKYIFCIKLTEGVRDDWKKVLIYSWDPHHYHSPHSQPFRNCYQATRCLENLTLETFLTNFVTALQDERWGRFGDLITSPGEDIINSTWLRLIVHRPCVSHYYFKFMNISSHEKLVKCQQTLRSVTCQHIRLSQ